MTIANIETLTRLLTDTTTTTLTAAQLLILENKYYEEIVGKIISETSGASWQFGDFNYTAFPTFTVTMTADQAVYDLRDWGTTDASTILTIMGVEVADENGDWHRLDRVSLKQIQECGFTYSEYSQSSARPTEYEIRDNILVLHPAPDNGVNVTLSSGLKLYFLRTADKFTSAEQSTGTKEPGFPSPWHDLLSWGPAYDYAMTRSFSNAVRFKEEYDRKLKQMLNFIARRDQDIRPILTMKRISHI